MPVKPRGKAQLLPRARGGNPRARQVPEGFRASLMSDTKWRKLFRALEPLQVHVCRIKWIDSEEVVQLQMPSGADLSPPRPYVDSSRGPFALRLVEWLEFPREVVQWPPAYPGAPLTGVRQQVDEAHALLESLGAFPMELTAGGLRIIGHQR